MLKEIDYWCRMSNNQTVSNKISQFIGGTNIGLRKISSNSGSNQGVFDFKDSTFDP